ncbi:MAG: ATP-binding protein [Bacillota bacterium]|nr:MAG: ATP-binding protein [Bacillota bacterium]
MSECTHDCSNCSADCGERKEKESFLKKPHELSNIKRVIGVVSGKGGVGKSMVTSMLSVLFNRRGYKTAVMDADVTGPSIPRMFGIKERAQGGEQGLLPVKSKTGIEIMSINLLLENESDPVVWRGPVIGGVVQQFWTDVIWNDVDYMFVDMPPGTGDVPLTVFQSLPVDGIVVVASPQELVSMIVEKAVKMANMMNIPVLGVVENMSYLECPKCGEKMYLFGESAVKKVCEEYSLPLLAEIPVKPELAKQGDRGLIELFEGDFMENAAAMIETLMQKKQ